MMNPATMAVQSPRPGATPLAIANAIASGSATMPTMTPAMASLANCARSYVLRVVTSLGTSRVAPCVAQISHALGWSAIKKK